MVEKKASKKIPILAVTGFLGSGKTTFVNHVLAEPHGLKIGVVVNDFGAINIDSELVAGKTDTKLELSNGCICCSLETLDVQEAIAQFAYLGSDIDLIVIEASGLAEPRDLALNLRDMIGIGVRLDAIVTLIDAEHVIENAQKHKNAADQIEFTDFVIINKIDTVEKDRIAEIRQLVDMTNPRARIFEAVRADVDIRLLTDPDRVWGGVKAEKHHHDDDHADHEHFHEQFKHVSLTLDRPLHPMKFQEFVNSKIPKTVSLPLRWCIRLSSCLWSWPAKTNRPQHLLGKLRSGHGIFGGYLSRSQRRQVSNKTVGKIHEIESLS